MNNINLVNPSLLQFKKDPVNRLSSKVSNYVNYIVPDTTNAYTIASNKTSRMKKKIIYYTKWVYYRLAWFFTSKYFITLIFVIATCSIVYLFYIAARQNTIESVIQEQLIKNYNQNKQNRLILTQNDLLNNIKTTFDENDIEPIPFNELDE